MNWFDKPEMLALFMHFLSSANDSDYLDVHRGQLKISLSQLNGSTGFSKMTLRTCIKRLKELGLIETLSSNRHTIISICNYDEYVMSEEVVEPKSEEIETEENTEVEEKPKKPVKTKKEIEEDTNKRMDKFYQELVPYVKTYGREMIREFYDYWSETNKSKSRMRFEGESTWDLNRRLQRWASKQKIKGNKTSLHGSENKDYKEGGW